MFAPPRSDTPQLQSPIDQILWPTGDIRTLRVDEQHPHEILFHVTQCAKLIYDVIDPDITIEDLSEFTLDGIDCWAQFRYNARKPGKNQSSFLWLELCEGENLSGKPGGEVVCALDLGWDYLHNYSTQEFDCDLPKSLGGFYEHLRNAGRKLLWIQYIEREELAKRHPLWHPNHAVSRTCNWGIEKGKPRVWGKVVKGCPGALARIEKLQKVRRDRIMNGEDGWY